MATNRPPEEQFDYERFEKVIEDKFGLHFPEKRRSELEHGIRQAFAASTCATIDDFYRQLVYSSDSPELELLTNSLTVGESHFFRDAGQFDALYQHVLPGLIEQRRQLRTLRIWSAGCSSGEEPYSIAMMLRELIPDISDWAITILATDINTQALDRARHAIYSDWAFREERALQARRRCFVPSGKSYLLSPEVRRMVTFQYLNLAEDRYPSYETNTLFLDMIICRNVTIYFADNIIQQVIGRFYEALGEGGWLVVGHSEYSINTYNRFRIHNFPDTVLYQKLTLFTPETAGGFDWGTAKVFAGPDASTSTQQTGVPDKASHLKETHPTKDLVEHARQYMEEGHTEQALQVLLGITQKKSPGAVVCTLLGQAYANQGNWSEAERWCREAINLNKLGIDAYYILALVLQHSGQIDQAIEMLKKVIYINSRHILGHFGLADLYYKRGLLPQALKSLDNARLLLDELPDNDVIPGSNGLTVSRLRATIVHQGQQWREAQHGH